MQRLDFDIYGYRIAVESSDFALEKLKINSDFKYFKKNTLQEPNLTIQISQLKDQSFKGFFLAKTLMCEVRQVSISERQLVYRHNSEVLAIVNDIATSRKRKIVLSALNLEIIDDVLYFLINSAAGEYLDSIGLMRLHAVSLKNKETVSLIHGRSKSGKSTIALKFLEIPNLSLYSDEISLLDLKTGFLKPYPIRISSADLAISHPSDSKFTYFFNTKKLIPIPDNQIATPAPLQKIFSLNSGSKTYFFISLILGLGLIQMWEYLLRLNNFGTLLKIFINRVRLIAHLNKFNLQKLDSAQTIEQKINSIL